MVFLFLVLLFVTLFSISVLGCPCRTNELCACLVFRRGAFVSTPPLLLLAVVAVRLLQFRFQ